MTTAIILSCILWVKGDYTTLMDVPVSEYGMAEIQNEKSGFLFEADVLEERLNSLKIKHIKKDVSTSAYTYEHAQRTLYVKLSAGADEASLTCEIKKNGPVIQ